MTRLINADELKSVFTEKSTEAVCGAELCKAIISRIDEAPTIDAVEVVRCKDCRWGREVCGNIECNIDAPEYHGYDWYCANGDKKNGRQGNDIHKISQMARIG